MAWGGYVGPIGDHSVVWFDFIVWREEEERKVALYEFWIPEEAEGYEWHIEYVGEQEKENSASFEG